MSRAVTPSVEATPRETITLRLRLENQGDRIASFTPEVTPPIGWSVLVPPGEVRLAPGESRVVLFSLLVAPEAQAGAYGFPVTYYLSRDAPRRKVRFEVRVPRIERMTLTRLEGPAHVTSGRFTTRFLLRNEGTAPLPWTLNARSSASLPLELTPERGTLDPGASTEIVVHAVVPNDLPTSTTHILTLSIEHMERPEVQAVARSTSELIPLAPSATTTRHTFPLTVRFEAGFAYGGRARLAGPVLELSGSGPLSDRDPGRLSVRFESALLDPRRPEEVRVSYRGPDGRFTVGHQSLERSAFLGNASGVGASGERHWELDEDVDLTASAAAYVADAALAVTAAADLAIDGGYSAGARAYLSHDGLIATFDADYHAPVADPTRIELVLLEGSYAIHVHRGLKAPGHALRLQGRVREGTSTLDLRYDARTAAFAGDDRHRTDLQLRAALRLNEALGFDRASPLDLHLEYRNEGTRPVAEGEPRDVRTLGATLTARLGRTSVSLGHREERARERSATDRVATTHLQAHVPLGDGNDLRQRVEWIRTEVHGYSSRLEYEGAATFVTPGAGRATVRLDVGLLLDDSRLNELELGARWSGLFSPAFRFQADVAADLLGRGEVLGMELEGRREFANNHRLDVVLDAALREGLPPRVALAVGYLVPLDVSIGLRSDVGAVRGSVRTAAGVPLEGVIVTAGGATAVTRADGGFLLPAVPEGEQRLHLLPDTIPIMNPIVVPDVPALVEVRGGVTAELHFAVTPGATVEGRLVPRAPEATDDRAALGPASSADRWLQGAVAELTNGDTTLRATTDASGTFRLLRVPPGSWTLRLRHPNLPSDYRIEPAEREIHVEAGERAEADFQLVPVTRTIRFQEGEQIGGD